MIHYCPKFTEEKCTVENSITTCQEEVERLSAFPSREEIVPKEDEEFHILLHAYLDTLNALRGPQMKVYISSSCIHIALHFKKTQNR